MDSADAEKLCERANEIDAWRAWTLNQLRAFGKKFNQTAASESLRLELAKVVDGALMQGDEKRDKLRAGLEAWRNMAIGFIGDPGAGHLKGPELREAFGNAIARGAKLTREAEQYNGNVSTSVRTFDLQYDLSLPSFVTDRLRVGGEVRSEAWILYRAVGERIERSGRDWIRTLWLARVHEQRGEI